MRQKRFAFNICVVILAILLLATVLVACHDDEGTKVKVSFVVDGQTIKTVEIPLNGKLGQTDIPDAYKEGFEFVGWFDGEAKLDPDMRYLEDTVYTAEFAMTNIYASFVDGGSEVKRKEFEITGGALTADDIPTPKGSSGKIFMGWWAEYTQATAGLQVTANTTFVAAYASESDYDGFWVDTDAHLLLSVEDGILVVRSDPRMTGMYARFNEAAGVFTKGENTYGNYAAGTLTAMTEEYEAFFKSYTILMTGENTAIMTALEDISPEYGEVEIRQTAYRLARCTDNYFPAGLYSDDMEYYSFDILSNGVIYAALGNEDIAYGYVYPTADGYSIEFRAGVDSESLTKYPAKLDEMGNLVITLLEGTRIFVKDALTMDVYYAADEENNLYDELREYHFEGGAAPIFTYVVDETKCSYYAQVEGELKNGNDLIITYKGIAHSAQMISGDTFRIAGSEEGTYSGADGVLRFDGFGGATLAGQDIEYEYNDLMDVIYTGNKVYALNRAEGTYSVLTTPDRFAELKFIYTYNASNDGSDNGKVGSVEVTFDGFGRFGLISKLTVPEVENGEPTTTVIDTRSGIYGIDGAIMTLRSGSTDLKDGDYNIKNDGKVLENVFDRSVALIKDGESFEYSEDDYMGFWQSVGGYTAYIYKDEYNVIELELSEQITPLRLSVSSDGSNMFNDVFNCTVTIVAGKLRVEYENVSRDYEFVSKNKPVTIEDSFVGNWLCGDGSRYAISKDDFIVNDTSVMDSVIANSYGGYEFDYEGRNYLITLDVYKQLWVRPYDQLLYGDRALYKVGGINISSDFIGEYSGVALIGYDDPGFSEFSVEISISATEIIFNGEPVTYYSFSHYDYNSTDMLVMYVDVQGVMMDVIVYFNAGEGYTMRFVNVHVKDAEDIELENSLYLFFNVWEHENYIIDMNGRGTVVFSKDGGLTSVMTSYTASDGVARFTIDSTAVTVTLKGDGSVSVTFGAESFDAQIKADPFIGTWTGSDAEGIYTYEFIFDGYRNLTIKIYTAEGDLVDTIETTYTVTSDNSDRAVASFLYQYTTDFTIVSEGVANAFDGVNFIAEEFTLKQ